MDGIPVKPDLQEYAQSKRTMKPNLKDLKTAHRVLTILDYPVPSALMLYLSSQITETEKAKKQKRMEHMSEEQLIAEDKKKHTRLRVTLKDGRFIQLRHNKDTFEQVIKEIDSIKAAHDLTLGKKQVFHIDPSGRQRRVKNYVFVKPGFFVLKGKSTNQMKEILETLDETMRMGWDVELI